MSDKLVRGTYSHTEAYDPKDRPMVKLNRGAKIERRERDDADDDEMTLMMMR